MEAGVAFKPPFQGSHTLNASPGNQKREQKANSKPDQSNGHRQEGQSDAPQHNHCANGGAEEQGRGLDRTALQEAFHDNPYLKTMPLSCPLPERSVDAEQFGSPPQRPPRNHHA